MARNTQEENNVNEVENTVQTSGADVDNTGSGITQTQPSSSIRVPEKTEVEFIAEMKKVKDVSVSNLERFDANIQRSAEKIKFNMDAMSAPTREKLDRMKMKYGISRPKINVQKEVGGVRISVMPGNRPIMREQENGYQANIPDWGMPPSLFIITSDMWKGFAIPARDAINLKAVLDEFFKEHRDLMEFGRDMAIDIENAEALQKKKYDEF